MDYRPAEREIYNVTIDKSLIHSGDFFTVYRLDGLPQLIQYGTGSYTTHCTMALWMDDELYIVESQGGGYWPSQGIQRTLYDDWITYANNADYWVIWLPLKDELRDKFNTTAALDFFAQTDGHPYGYHNFIFGWVDTPEDNMPPLLPVRLVPPLFSVLEKVIPAKIDKIYTKGMNMHLGVNEYTLDDLTVLAASENLNMEEVMAIVEMDGWEYDDGVSYVCSSYVVAMYKHAGLFDDLEVQGVEFTPKDLYTLDFFNSTQVRPEQCVEADPDIPYCQLMGPYRVDYYPGYSTIAPYNNMAENCPTVWPDHDRPEGC